MLCEDAIPRISCVCSREQSEEYQMVNPSKMMLVLFSIGFILTVAGADSNCVARNDEAMALVNGTRVLEMLRELQRFGATGEGEEVVVEY